MTVAQEPRTPSTPGALVLGVLTAGTALIAAWLALVLATVLPARSAASIPTWAGITALAVVLVVLGLAWLARPSRLLALALQATGLAVGVVGAWLVAAWLGTPPGDGGEGYEVAIGAWFVLHGAVAVLIPALRAGRRPAGRPRAGTTT